VLFNQPLKNFLCLFLLLRVIT